MEDSIWKIDDLRNPEKVEEEIDKVLQALEELNPKPQKAGGKLQMVSGEEGTKEGEALVFLGG